MTMVLHTLVTYLSLVIIACSTAILTGNTTCFQHHKIIYYLMFILTKHNYRKEREKKCLQNARQPIIGKDSRDYKVSIHRSSLTSE